MLYQITKEYGELLLLNENSFKELETYKDGTNLLRAESGKYQNVRAIDVSETGKHWSNIYTRKSS